MLMNDETIKEKSQNCELSNTKAEQRLKTDEEMTKTDKHAATSGLKRIANMFKKKTPAT